MKTFYTLLLAFGLCLTSHAQSNSIYTLAEKKALLNNQQQENLNTLLFDALPTIIFSNNQVYKAFTATNSINKKIFLEDQYTLINDIESYDLLDFQTTEVLSLKWENGKTYSIDADLLQNMPNLKYIYLICHNSIAKGEVTTLMQNILSNVSNNVEVIFEIYQGG